MTVVLVGEGDYEELDLLSEAVERRGSETVVWDTTDWPGGPPVTYDIGSGTVTVGEEFDVESVTGVFPITYQMFDMLRPRFADDFETEGAAHLLHHLDQWRSVFESLIGLFDRRGADVFYPPGAQQYHANKPLQMEQMAQAGVSIPETVFATSPDRIREFVSEHGTVVYKPVAAWAMPNQLSESDLEDESLEQLSNAPVQFQEYVPGDDLRVYFLDGEIVGASRYVTDGWTYKEDLPDDAERVELRDEISRDVERAAHLSPMRFGAVDVRATDDTYALLEINPAPRFALHDLEGPTDVAGALADQLV